MLEEREGGASHTPANAVNHTSSKANTTINCQPQAKRICARARSAEKLKTLNCCEAAPSSKPNQPPIPHSLTTNQAYIHLNNGPLLKRKWSIVWMRSACIVHQSKRDAAPNQAFFAAKPIGFQNQTHWVLKSNPLGFKTKPIGF